ncbi:MAG: glycogen debranching enzyme N-terminal domain-containing protein [Alloprevotella sp.]|nr:glycogen debranching enzyme N-terminal domain-containing protein [Alloprevotella sp.]
MYFLHFDKNQMTNLQDSLFKEFLITSRTGAYCSTTLVGCNIRKYHGLLVAPVPQLGDDNYVFLSSLDETVIQHGAEFNLGIHKYAGDNYSPKGHKYITQFYWEKVPTWIYRIGGVYLKKEISYGVFDSRLYIRYTLLEANSPTTLRLKPFLAFRSVRQWTHANGAANQNFQNIENGIKMCLYEGYPELFMQLNTAEATFNYSPNWYMNLEYPKERERGYDSCEDLLVPGYFEMPIRKGESIVFSASVNAPVETRNLSDMIDAEIAPRLPLNSFYHCLIHAAHQFKYQENNENYVLAGYHWFKCRARDSFVALPGLTLSIGEIEEFERYMETACKAIEDFLAGRPISVKIYEMDKPDVLLWAIYCIQQYAKYTSEKQCYEKYGALLLKIVNFIIEGKHPSLFLHDNGLLYSNGRDTSISWMNSMLNGKPIVPRSGYLVEFNALWYNALRFSIQLANSCGNKQDKTLTPFFERLSEKVAVNFRKTFLNDSGYLLDYVDGQIMDWSVRPNQLLAIALDYSPLEKSDRKSVLDMCTKELVTPKGIRSLSPKSVGYDPLYVGPQYNRDQAYYQGTAWPWLTGFYLSAYLKVYKMSGVNYIERQLIGFEEELYYHCIGTIPELFDGNPRFSGRGAISYAMNVAGILTALRMIEKLTHQDEDEQA